MLLGEKSGFGTAGETGGCWGKAANCLDRELPGLGCRVRENHKIREEKKMQSCGVLCPQTDGLNNSGLR